MTLRDYDNFSCPGCGEQAPAGTTKAGWDHHMATCDRLALLADAWVDDDLYDLYELDSYRLEYGSADDGEGGLT